MIIKKNIPSPKKKISFASAHRRIEELERYGVKGRNWNRRNKRGGNLRHLPLRRGTKEYDESAFCRRS